MTALFDGMATLLNGTFGDVVIHRPVGGGVGNLSCVFRRDPTVISDGAEGDILTTAPTVLIQKPAADAIGIGDKIEPPGGVSYRVVNRQSNSSPASDAFVIFELEEV